MIKEKKSLKNPKVSSRRKFIAKAAAASGAVVAGGILAGCEPAKKEAAVVKQETVTLKMQAACILRVNGAQKATLGIATAVAAAAPVAAAALKNLRLEGVLEPFNDFLSLIICISSLS